MCIEKEREELREQVYAALAEEEDKPTETKIPTENVSSDQDVVHEEPTSPEKTKVNSPAVDSCAAVSEKGMETEILGDCDEDDKNEPMDVEDSHQKSGDGAKEDVKKILEDKTITGEEVTVPEEGENVTTDASLESVGKIEQERKISLPLQKDIEDDQDKAEKPAQANLIDADSEEKVSVEKIDGEQGGNPGCEEPIEEGEGII